MSELGELVSAINDLKVSQATLSTTIQNMVVQLQKQNGTVVDLAKRMASLEEEVHMHPDSCIMKDKVNTLEYKMMSHLDDFVEGRRKKNDLIQGFIYPVLKWAAVIMLGGIGMLLIQHANVWLNSSV